MRWKPLAICVVITSVTSCLLKEPTGGTRFATYEHILGIKHESALIKKVHDEYWHITYKYAANCAGKKEKITEAGMEKAITKALQIWLQPLRDMQTKKPIVNDFRFNKVSYESTLPDLRVMYHCIYGTSQARLTPPELYIRTSSTEVIPYFMYLLMHEMGHTFGLADIYVGGRQKSTGGLNKAAGTQPASVMAGFFVESIEFSWITADDWDKLQYISQDDVNGIVWLYKYHHENQPLEDCHFANYVFQESPRGCVPLHPIIFELKHGNKRLAIRTINEDPSLDLNVRDGHDHTALDYTIIHEYDQALHKLLQHKNIKVNAAGRDGHTALHLAAAGGYEFGVEKLLAHKDINVNPVDKKGRTPLHLAAEHGSVGVVKQLLGHKKINVNVRDNRGYTALHYAIVSKSTAVLSELLAHKGFEVNTGDTNGFTPLHLAASNGFAQGGEMLLVHKEININPVDKENRTPLHLAAKHGSVDIVKKLLGHIGSKINAQDNSGYTALHYAAAYKAMHYDSEVYDKLIARGVDETIKNKSGHTASTLITVIRSDVNRDNAINILDLTLVSTHMGKEITQSSPVNMRRADVNMDGAVDIRDLVIVGNSFK